MRLAPLVRLLARAHALPVLEALEVAPSPVRFVALQHKLGVAPNTLAERLRELTGAGLLVRTDHGGIPPHVDYALTPKARDLLGVLRSVAAGFEEPPVATVARVAVTTA